MRRTKKQWDYEESEPIQDLYEEDKYMVPEEYGGVPYDDYDDSGSINDYGDDLASYGSDLRGCLGDDAFQDGRDRVERIQDATFLLNETDKFKKHPDARKIRDNFKTYVIDSKSSDPAVRKAANEGACRDLEFFVISLIIKKFSTYVKKDRSFYDDLLQAGRMGIMKALPEYDPDKSMPTTYFFNPIKHEMGLQANTMKHDIKPYVATIKGKIQEVDRMFARYGRTPELHDYVYSIRRPFRCIMNALAEIRAGNMKTSIDDPEAAPLADWRHSIWGPEESVISNMNAGAIMKLLYEIEPRKEIVDCFIDLSISGRQKTSELAERYGLTTSEVAEGCRSLVNLIRNHPEFRKMYPERFRVKEHELSGQITYIPVEEGRIMENVLDPLWAMPGEGVDVSFS